MTDYGTALKLTVGWETGIFAIECDVLKIIAHGDTLALALHDFADQVRYFTDHYMGLPNNKCIGDAARLKRLYAGLTRSEEQR